jgi:hypothetical protein
MPTVRTDVLLLAYAQISIIEAMCHDATRKTATDAAWLLYYQLAPEQDRNNQLPESAALRAVSAEAQAIGRAGNDPAALQQYTKTVAELYSMGRRYTYRCLARSAATSALLLRLPPYDPATGAELAEAELDRVCWLLEAVRRIAEGEGNHLAAARAAYDASRHKPRRRRRPVAVAWLSEQVASALDAMWPALVATEPRLTR